MSKRLVYGFAGLAIVFGLAILAISPYLARVEVDQTVQTALPDVPVPPAMARALSPVEAAPEALTTPIFPIGGEPFTLPNLQGEGVVLNFWATWCPPCVKEMPALDALAKALESRGVRVLAVSEDRQAAERVPPFLDNLGVESIGRHYDEKGRLSRHLGVDALPTTILIDAEGRFIGQVVGVLNWDSPETVEFLAEALGPRAKPAPSKP